MPHRPRYPPIPQLRVRGPDRTPSGSCSGRTRPRGGPPSPHFRHSAGAGDGPDIAVDRRPVRSRRHPFRREDTASVGHRARDPPTRSKRRSQCGPRRGHSHFYMSITALSHCPTPYLTAFDVDYLVCRCIAVRQHDTGRVLMQCPRGAPVRTFLIPRPSSARVSIFLLHSRKAPRILGRQVRPMITPFTPQLDFFYRPGLSFSFAILFLSLFFFPSALDLF